MARASGPGVLSHHHTHLSAGAALLVALFIGHACWGVPDLHVWLPPEMTLVDAHARSHVVKDRVIQRFPQIKDAVIHIEPPPHR